MGNLGDVWWWGAWRWRSPWLGRCHGCLGDGGSLHGLRSPRQAVCSLLTGVRLALQRRFPRQSGMTICGRGARPHSKVSQQLTRI